jgi:hypothetical protein
MYFNDVFYFRKEYYFVIEFVFLREFCLIGDLGLKELTYLKECNLEVSGEGYI